MNIRRLKPRRPESTPALVTAGVLTITAAYNSFMAWSGRCSVLDAATKIAVQALILLTALLLTCFTDNRTYARFLCNAVCVGSAVIVTCALLSMIDTDLAATLDNACAYAVGMTAGLVLLFIVEQINNRPMKRQR